MTRGLLAVAIAAILLAVFALRPMATPGPQMRDFEAYWSAGATMLAHGDPYGRAIWQAERTVPGVDAGRDELLPFVGPPATLLLWKPLARLAYPAAAAVWLSVLIVALAMLAILTAFASASRAHGVGCFEGLAALALAIGFGPLTSDVALGQLALPAFAGAVALVVFAPRSITLATAGAAIAFAQPNAGVGIVSQIGRNRATASIALGAIAFYVLGWIAAGPDWPFAYARVLAAHSAAEAATAIQLSVRAIAHGLGAGALTATALGIAIAAIAVASAVAIARRVQDRFARFAAISALIPFVSFFTHEHDLLVAYAAAVWCALRTRGSARAIALAGTLLVAIDWLGLAQRPSGIAQSALLAVGAACAFLALGGVSRATALTAALVAAIFAVAATAAAAHPLAVWPDALGAFRAPVSATTAQVWLAEQRASGLLAAQPAWAALRSLSLLGCALLAAAIYRHSTCYRTP